jgi:hypothetical protein
VTVARTIIEGVLGADPDRTYDRTRQRVEDASAALLIHSRTFRT